MGRQVFAGLITAVLVGIAGVVGAADLYTSGDKTWDTSTANWGTAFGGPYDVATWNNATPDSAFVEGTLGSHTITLTEPISTTNLTFYDNTAADGGQPQSRSFTVQGQTLNFGSGGIIRAHLTSSLRGGSSVTIRSAITGRPDAYLGDNQHHLYLTPTNGTQLLGTCYIPYENGVWDKANLHLGGTTTGNSVTYLTYGGGNRWGIIYKEGTGTWSIGNVYHGGLYVEDGHLIATGEVHTVQSGLRLNGGVFHYNHAGAVKAGGFQLNNGAFDNSSGAAIATPTYNVAQTWGGNWTFIGSQGANSDLNIGTGNVTLSGHRTVTVSNALTILTVGGVIGDGTQIYGVTKAGAGTLKLTGDNTYNGNTTVSAGTLSLGDGTHNSSLDDDAIVSVATGAMLDLNFASTNADSVFQLQLGGSPAAVGTWGSTSSTADNKDDTYFSGTGVLNNLGGLAPVGTWYWDGSNYGGIGNGAADGGNGVWSTTSNNWDQGFVSRKAWPNTTNDSAIFRKPAGVVDLQSDITLGGILIDGIDDYTIGSTPESNTLHFGDNALVTVDGVSATIRAGITGSPDIHTPNGYREHVYLTPDVASMTIGVLRIGVGSSSNPEVHLRGTTTGNSVASVPSAHSYAFLNKEQSGTWTVGSMTVRELRLKDGTFVINGTMSNHGGINWTGGTLAGTGTVNEVVTVPASGTLAPGDTTGMLTITNNSCTINGTLAIAVDGAQHGSLAVDPSHTLTISNATLNVEATGTPGGKLVIATYGTLAGEFATTNFPDAGWIIDYAHAGGTAIAVSPPPAGSLFVVR